MPIIFILCGVLFLLNIFGVFNINLKLYETMFRLISILFLISFVTPYISINNVSINIFYVLSIILIIFYLSFLSRFGFNDFCYLVVLIMTYYLLLNTLNYNYYFNCFIFTIFMLLLVKLYSSNFYKCLTSLIFVGISLNIIHLYFEFNEYGFVLISFNIFYYIFLLAFVILLFSKCLKILIYKIFYVGACYEKKNFYRFNFVNYNS